MNKLQPNKNLSFKNDVSFCQFSSGIEYCNYEQQIDLSSSLLEEEKQKKAGVLKIKQFLAEKKEIVNYNCQQTKPKENELIEKSQLLLKKLYIDNAWTYSLVALASVSIVSEITPIWSEGNNNLSSESPLLKTAPNLKSSANHLFPLLAIEEIELIISKDNDDQNLRNITPNSINNKNRNFELSQSTKSQVNQQKWLMHLTKPSGSLMAIPPVQNQPSLAGFASFVSTLNWANSTKYFNFNQSNSFNKNPVLSYPLDSVTYNIEDTLMAIPKTVYTPYLPKVDFLERS